MRIFLGSSSNIRRGCEQKDGTRHSTSWRLPLEVCWNDLRSLVTELTLRKLVYTFSAWNILESYLVVISHLQRKLQVPSSLGNVCFTKHPWKHGCLVYQEGMSISYITYRFESTKDSQFFRLHLASRKKLPYFTNLPYASLKQPGSHFPYNHHHFIWEIGRHNLTRDTPSYVVETAHGDVLRLQEAILWVEMNLRLARNDPTNI